MNAQRYAEWQKQVIEKLMDTNTIKTNGIVVVDGDIIKDNGFLIKEPSGQTMKINEEFYREIYKNSGSRSFPIEKSIEHTVHKCEEIINKWIKSVKG